MPRNPYMAKVKAIQTSQSKTGIAIQIKRTRKEQVDLGLRVCALYATGRYTLQDICASLSVSMVQFNKWSRPNINAVEVSLKGEPLPKGCLPEINEAYRKAKVYYQEIYAQQLKDRAQDSLLAKIEGTEYREVVEDQELDTREFLGEEPNPNFGKMMVTKRKVKTGKNAPDTAAIIFALTNVDPDNFKNTGKMIQQTNVQLNNNLGELSALSDEDLTKKYEELQKKVHVLTAARNESNGPNEDSEAFDDMLENDR